MVSYHLERSIETSIADSEGVTLALVILALAQIQMHLPQLIIKQVPLLMTM